MTVAEQRKALPDSPGVYLFKDAKGRVVYVGKAKSIRKRVGGHFSRPGAARGTTDMTGEIADIDFVVTQTEAEALLAEQSFIKRHRPRFNIRLRDDKSYPYVGISLDEPYPRVYFTREKHRANRAYFGPFSSAKRVRETIDLLGKVFQHRTCEGREPGRQSGSPCLEYFIKRCQAPCVGYVSQEEYRKNIDTIIRFLSGRYREIERDLEQEMKEAAAEQEFERAALMRNRLKAVRSLLERQRVTNEAVGTLDAIAVAAEGPDANAQVFQVRDGVLADRQSFYLENEAERDEDEVLEEFVLQYYASALSIPPQVIVAKGTERTDVLAEALAERRGGSVEVRPAERGDKRRILELADRNARLALDQDRLRSERTPHPADRGARRPAARAEDGADPDADRVLRHLEPGGDPHGRLDGGVRGRRAEEVRLPPLQGARRGAGRLRGDGRGAGPADVAVRRAEGAVTAREGLRRELRRAARADRDRRRQGPALGGAEGARRLPRRGGRRSSASPSSSRRCSCPAVQRR